MLLAAAIQTGSTKAPDQQVYMMQDRIFISSRVLNGALGIFVFIRNFVEFI